VSSAPHPVVLFDFDGTLADTIPLIIASFRHTVAEVLGVDLPEAEARSWIGRTLADTFGERYPAHARRMVETYRDWSLTHHDELIRTVEGVPTLLDGLVAAGCRLGVVSSKSEAVVRRGLTAVGIDHDFGVIIGLEATTEHKPKPDPLLHAAAELGAAPSECAYVGDAVVDVRAALAAHIRPIGVTWGAGERDELVTAGASAVVDTAEELLDVLVPRLSA
jgi:pyrophosphatase PpaX